MNRLPKDVEHAQVFNRIQPYIGDGTERKGNCLFLKIEPFEFRITRTKSYPHRPGQNYPPIIFEITAAMFDQTLFRQRVPEETDVPAAFKKAVDAMGQKLSSMQASILAIKMDMAPCPT